MTFFIPVIMRDLVLETEGTTVLNKRPSLLHAPIPHSVIILGYLHFRAYKHHAKVKGFFHW